MASSPLKKFLFPKLNRKFFLRVTLLIAASYIIFGHLLIPLHVKGVSMEPTYHDNSFAFCWRLSYLFSEPRRPDIVAVRFAGRKVMLMKRVVATAGETVEFRSGTLFVNGKAVYEPYIIYNSDWELAPRTVRKNHVYVVGDNRGTDISRHKFGEVHRNRIAGGIIP